MRLPFIALLMILTAGTAGAACSVPADAGRLAAEVVAGVNTQRQAAGLQPLVPSAALARAASRHACDMAANGLQGHRGSDGSNSSARARAAGFRGCTVAENVVWGFSSPGTAVAAWMGSAPHRANILNRGLTDLAVGVATGVNGANWVLVLGRRC